MPKPRNHGRHGRPEYNQAGKIIARFGGERLLAGLLNLNRVSVYRWQYRPPYGSNGLVPAPWVPLIRAAAREQGILLRPEDWVPERINYDECCEASVVAKLVPMPQGLDDQI